MNLFYEEQLQKLFTNINDWLKFAEAKNFGLITLNAAVLFGLNQINYEPDSMWKTVSFCILPPFLYVSLVFSLISFFPILSKISKKEELTGVLGWLSSIIDKEKKLENIHFYGYLRKLSKANFIAEYKLKTKTTEDFTKYEEELVLQILYNSRITWLKYQLFKIAGFFMLSGIVISPIAYLIIQWTK